ncbi:PKD domain-containing protein, partial [Solitalea sp. MAHUQ-68]
NGATPVASFTASATTVCQDGTVTLDATGSSTGVSPIKDYIWEFSEGGTVINTISAANQAVVSISFPAITSSHTYDVKLTVRTQDGCESSTAPQSITVHPVAVATLTADKPEVCVDGGVVTLTPTVTNGVAVGTPAYSVSPAVPAGTISGNTFNPLTAGAGTYTITYTAAATDGGCPSNSATVTIVIHPLPTPVVTPAGPAVICPNETLTLTATGATNYEWYEASAPTVSIASGTTFEVTKAGNYYAVGINTFGCDEVSNTVAVTEYPAVVASFGSNSNCVSASGVEFDASTSTGTITNYDWIFGDGTTGTGVTATHQYAAVGSYWVTLKVTSADGCTDTIGHSINFSGNKPLASFTLAPLGSSCYDVDYTLTNTSTMAGGLGSIAKIEWIITDELGNRVFPVGLDANLTATFRFDPSNIDKTYTITLGVTAANNCYSEATAQTVTIKARPDVTLAIPDSIVCLDKPAFALTGGAPAGGTYTGTGVTAGSFNPAVAGVGIHPITYTYAAANGCTASAVFNVSVQALPNPVITMTGNNPACEQRDTIRLTSSTASSYQWLMNGTVIPGATAQTFIPTQIGANTYSVMVTNEYTCAGTSSIPVDLTIYSKPKLDFDLPAECLVDTTVFVNKTTNADGSPVTYFWKFEDDPAKTSDLYSTDVDGRHFYMSNGPKKVTLYGTTDNGCLDSLTKVFNVKGDVPKVNFYLKGRASVCAGDNITLRDTSVMRLGVSYDYKWRFFDGATEINLNQEARNEITVFVPEIYAGKTLTAELTVTPVYGCPASHTSSFVIYQKPTVNFKLPVDTMCTKDAPLTLNTGTPAGGIYTIAGGKGIYNNVFYPDTAGAGIHVITYTYTDPVTQCFTAINDTISVFANPAAVVKMTTPDNVCEGTKVKLVAEGIGTSYEWLRNNVVIPGATKATYDADLGGFYQVRIINAAGCEDKSDSVQITIWPRPVARFDVPSSCMTDAIQFNNTSYITDGSNLGYLWNFGDGVGSISTQMNPSYSFKSPGMKHITLTVFSAHCDSTFAMDVMINGEPKANFVITSPQPYCSNDALIFEDKSTVKIGKVQTWSWKIFDENTGNPVANTNPMNGPTMVFNPPVSTVDATYNVRLIVSTGSTCVDSIQYDFTVKPSPVVALGPLANICMDVPSVKLTGGSPADGVGGAGTFSGIGVKNGNFYPQKAGPGLHTVMYTFQAANFCKDTAQQQIRVYESPVIDCMDFDVFIGKSVKLDMKLLSKESASYTYKWLPAAGLDDPTSLTPTVLSATADMTYTLYVTNAEGCVSTCNVHVNVLPDLKIPDVITPNGDNVNDKWDIPGIEKYPDVEVYVYNRYGDKIYYSKGYADQWDGSRDGRPVPPATYYYVIKPNKDQLKPRAGAITIIY